ncbi:MAG: hypothetical protein ABI866_06740 [Dokdonella sp.]
MKTAHGCGEIELGSAQMMFSAFVKALGKHATVAALLRSPGIAGLFGDRVQAAAGHSGQR